MVTIDVNSQPYTLAEGAWDEIRDSVADRGDREARAATSPTSPTRSSRARSSRPTDLESLLGIWGGHALHGEMSFDQLFNLRPVRGWADYRTPVRDLWLCGAGTHPGGGVTGANGRNCAREVLREHARHRRAACGEGADEPADPRRVGCDRGAGDHRRAARGRAAARSSAGSSANAYPGLANHLAPLALTEKRGWTVTDADGNVYLDLASASASVPLGAGRAELLEPAIEALRRFGNEDSHALVSELTALSSASACSRSRPRASPATTSRSTAPRRSRSRSR